MYKLVVEGERPAVFSFKFRIVKPIEAASLGRKKKKKKNKLIYEKYFFPCIYWFKSKMSNVMISHRQFTKSIIIITK